MSRGEMLWKYCWIQGYATFINRDHFPGGNHQCVEIVSRQQTELNLSLRHCRTDASSYYFIMSENWLPVCPELTNSVWSYQCHPNSLISGEDIPHAEGVTDMPLSKLQSLQISPATAGQTNSDAGIAGQHSASMSMHLKMKWWHNCSNAGVINISSVRLTGFSFGGHPWRDSASGRKLDTPLPCFGLWISFISSCKISTWWHDTDANISLQG